MGRSARSSSLSGDVLRAPVPGQQFVNALRGMIWQAGEQVGKPSLRVDIVKLCGRDQGVDRSWLPSSEPAKVQLRRPTATARSFRSAALFDMQRRLSSRKRSAAQRLRP